MTKLYNINIQGERSKAMRKLMMGIDIGTQSIRVALVDTDGNIIAMRRHSHFIETPKPNWAVQDPASWWNILKKEIHNENDTVKLMTLHASKGLEFSHVFITGVNYGLIPLQTKSFEEEEEEQRLFFVGITRAKEHLELSYYTSPGQYRAAPGPSRYLRMIPGNLIEGQEKERESSATHLQDLKRQILAERANQSEHIELQEAGKISGGKNPSANTGTKNISVGNEAVTTQKRRVRHPKYGTGSVVREDDMMITVDFDDYGEKELMKMFGGLEELP